MRKSLSCLLLALFLTIIALPLTAAAEDAAIPAPDPSGASVGTAADVVGATAGAPTKEEMASLSEKEPLAAKLADVVGHNRISINMV